MDNAIVRATVVGYKNEYQLQGPNKDFDSSNEDCLPKISPREPSSIKKLQITDFYTQKLFLQQISSLKKMLPKQIVTLEEKYLRHCLELIHMSGMRENSWSISSNVNRLPDRFSSRVVGGDTLFLFSSGNKNVGGNSSVEDQIVGSITGSTSMINLLNSPLLLRQSENDDINYGNPSEIQIQKKRVISEDQFFECDYAHKRLVSFSSTNSIFSDPSSSSTSSSLSSSAYCQGMLHCSWNNGFPRYVFSVEDHREVYTTNLSKIENNCIYKFYSRAGKKENKIHDDESDLIGKMSVSTSFTPCPFGTGVMETQFILCGTGNHSEEGAHTINQTVKKNKGLSKKVSTIFKGNHFHNRQRTSSKFDGSVVIQENLLESNEEGNVFPDSSFCSNLELAAIVVKDHIPYSQKKVEVGGWGLKFLKDDGLKQNIAIPEPCRQNTCSHHSSSMDVVIPAGFHGGPRTKTGGPSSLVERWRSGGFCDCGGWDIGCPLTVLSSGSNNRDVFYQAGVFGKSNSFELFTQGCKQSLPVIEVTNVRDGLYYIHYQSTMSALQSLSIAVAIIHSHSPTLKPKVYMN